MMATRQPASIRWLAVSPDKRPSAEAFRRELAVLTRRDEQRARRTKLLRSVVPAFAAVLAIFFAIVAELSRAAEASRTEAAQASERAERARDRAATISQSLTQQAALREALEAKTREAEATRDRYLRTVAEFDNYRKRAAREREEVVRSASEALVRDLHPVLDNFDRALSAARKDRSAAFVSPRARSNKPR